MSSYTDHRTTVSINTALTIRTCQDYICDIVSRIGASEAATIDLAACDDVDITGVQVIEAARRFAQRKGVDLRLAAPVEGRWLDVLELGGFLEAATPADRAFWLHETGVS